jgi:hypothetical protein
MKPRPSPKLDIAVSFVAAVLSRARAEFWSLHRMRQELKAAQRKSGVSRTTFGRAIVRVTGMHARKLRDPKKVHAVLERVARRAA